MLLFFLFFLHVLKFVVFLHILFIVLLSISIGPLNIYLCLCLYIFVYSGTSRCPCTYHNLPSLGLILSLLALNAGR